jgi:hypothetical protein
MNPLQGMTSMLMGINPYFNPAAWVFQTDVHETLKMIVSFVVYFLEVTVSTFALGVTLGFSRPFSFVSALWLALLLFPPFNFVFGLAGWLATAPIYGHTLALSICCSSHSSRARRRMLSVLYGGLFGTCCWQPPSSFWFF